MADAGIDPQWIAMAARAFTDSDKTAAERALDEAVAAVKAYELEEDLDKEHYALAVVVEVLKVFAPLETALFARIAKRTAEDERAKVAEEIAKAIEARAAEPLGPGAMVQWHGLRDAAAIARQHAANGPRIAVEAPTAHAESHRMGEGSSGAQEAVG